MFDLRTEWIPAVWHFENYPNATVARAVRAIFHQQRHRLGDRDGRQRGVLHAWPAMASPNSAFRGSGLVLLLILSTLMLPLEVTLVPTFLIVHKFEWMNTYQGIVAPLLIDAFGVFLMRQSIISIPSDYIEAARIDGAGELRILLQIIVPQCLPALSVLAIFSFRDSWDQFLWPLTVVSIDSSSHLSARPGSVRRGIRQPGHRADGDRGARHPAGLPSFHDPAEIDQSRVWLERTEIEIDTDRRVSAARGFQQHNSRKF